MAPNRTQNRKYSSSNPESPLEDPNATPMLRYQKNLPSLPVPPLETTLTKYYGTITPHFSEEGRKRTNDAVQKFLASPISKTLQERLQARASEPGMENWLAEWWDEVAYMGYRDPVVVYVSYFYVHKDGRGLGGRGDATGPVERAARLIKSLLPFRALVES